MQFQHEAQQRKHGRSKQCARGRLAGGFAALAWLVLVNMAGLATAATGIITTVAGNGTAAFSGDGGPATSASLNQPFEIVGDAAGHFYIVDRVNHRVRRVEAVTGIITTYAGTGTAGFSGDGGPATSAQLNEPFGVAMDAAGRLLISDTLNHRIRRVVFADAGPDQTVDEGTLVTLDGSRSSDPDGDTLTFLWTQLGGPGVPLDMSNPVRPTFIAPSVPAGGATLTFELTVSDGTVTSADVVNITVKNVNRPPVADAGAPQTVNEGSAVTLDGSASFDPDGEALTFSWVQTAGPAVTLADANTAQASFIAPFVGQEGAMLTLTLTVSDGIDAATAPQRAAGPL